MMKAWFLVLVISISLAGCGGKDDPLAPYMMKSSETPDSCFYWQPGEQEAEYLALAGFTENPGSINPDFLVLDGIQPVKNRIGVFECKFGEETALISTVVGKFEDSRQATDWILAAQGEGGEFISLACSEHVRVFVDGEFVGGIATDSTDDLVQQAIESAFGRILEDTGAKEYCPS